MERRKTKQVIEIEERLNPDKVFFSPSRCCGDGWFMDFNYMNPVAGEPSWRIQHNLKTKKLNLVRYKSHVSSVGHLRFKTTKELFAFIDKHFGE